MAKRLQNFIEDTYQAGNKPVVDRDAGVIRGVKILGRDSRNKVGGASRQYSDRALQQAATMYEGIGVNTNHPDRATPGISRSVEDGLGWLESVELKPDGVYGDLHVIKAHPMANTLFEVAERKPDRFGLSHNASGDSVARGGKMIVESLEKIRSVDLVQNPATVNSLFESEDPVATRTVKDILEQLTAGPQKSRLIQLMEMDGMPYTPEMPVPEMPVEGDAKADPFDEVIRSGLLAIWDDPTLDLEGKKAKIAKLLDISGDMTEPEPAPETDTETPVEGDTAVTESVEDLKKRLGALEAELLEAKTEKECRALLESKQLEVTDKRLNLLKSVKPATRSDLIEEWVAPKQKPVAQKPGKSPPAPLLEGEQHGAKAPRGAKEMLAAYSR